MSRRTLTRGGPNLRGRATWDGAHPPRRLTSIYDPFHRKPLRPPVESAQYVALGFGQQARDAGIAVSMGSRGDAYDNAVAESFFATIKKELVHRQSWPSRRDLSSAVFDYIEAFYNRQRRYSTLGYLSPEEYENTTPTTTKET